MSGYLERSQRRDALERVKTARAELSKLWRVVEADMDEARNADPRDAMGEPLYTASGLAQHREQLVEQVRSRHRQQLDQLNARVQTDAGEIRRHADRTRPVLGTDAAAQSRARTKWDQARMRLDAGMSIHRVIAGADTETLLAIRDWAPSYLEAQAYETSPPTVANPWQAPDMSGLYRAIDDRLAAVTGDEVSEALEAGREVEKIAAGFDIKSAHVAAVLDGQTTTTDAISAAVSAHYAEQNAAGGVIEDDGPAAA